MHSTLLYCKCFVLLFFLHFSLPFRKVIVPAVYDEWSNNSVPLWATNKTLMLANGYEVFVYQKQDPRDPNFIATNRGSESKYFFLLCT